MHPVIRDLKGAVFSLDGAPPTYGGPSLSGAVDGVSPSVARYRLDEAGRSIWEIVLHAAYWRWEVARAVSGATLPRFPRGPENWPSVPVRADEEAWRTDRALLEGSEEALVRALDDFTLEGWSRTPPGGGQWTVGQLMAGLMAHDAYHVGQVIVLKKAASLASA